MRHILTWFIDCNNICHTSYNQTVLHDKEQHCTCCRRATIFSSMFEIWYLVCVCVFAAPNGKYKANLGEVFNVCIVLVFHFDVIESVFNWLVGWQNRQKRTPSGHDTCFPHFPANCLHTETPSNVNHSENIGYTLSISHICFLWVSFLPHSMVTSPSCRTFRIGTINSSLHTAL